MRLADSTDTRLGDVVYRDLVNCHARTARCEILHQLYFLLLQTCATLPRLSLDAPYLRLPNDLMPLVVTAALVHRPTLRGSCHLNNSRSSLVLVFVQLNVFFA